MRTTTMNIDKTVGEAKLGSLLDLKLNIECKVPQLVPYIKGGEDIAVLMYHSDLLHTNQPIEFNGFNTKSLLNRATKIKEDVLESPSGKIFTDLTREHICITSFSPEVVWLAKKSGTDAFKSSFETHFPYNRLGLKEKSQTILAEILTNAIQLNPKTYGFWRFIIANKHEEVPLIRTLLEWSIEVAIRTRSDYLAGMVPIIDKRGPNSIVLNHRINEAYGRIIHDRDLEGFDKPKYFYTVALNSTMFQDHDWTAQLAKVLRTIKLAITQEETRELYNGVHVVVRGLPIISKTFARTSVLKKFVTDLNQIVDTEKLPLWLSRFGVPGLSCLDMGTPFTSFPINMNHGDTFVDGGTGNKLHKFGKIINIDMVEFQDLNTVKRLVDSHRLPEVDTAKNSPSEEEKSNDRKYRLHFSKPYNIGGMNKLQSRWEVNINNGEINPGTEYVKQYDVFSGWE